MRRVAVVTLGSPGLRAGKSPAFLVLRGLDRSGRSRTKKTPRSRPPPASTALRLFPDLRSWS